MEYGVQVTYWILNYRLFARFSNLIASVPWDRGATTRCGAWQQAAKELNFSNLLAGPHPAAPLPGPGLKA
jgi:hypothetical protein